MGSLETFSYKERLHGDFSFYDNCVDEVSINGQTEQTGKISYLVDFSCRMLADNNASDKVEVASNNESSLDTTKIVPETDEELKNAEVESSSVNSYQVLQKVFYMGEITKSNNKFCSFDTFEVSRRLQE